MANPWQPLPQQLTSPLRSAASGKALRAETAFKERQSTALQMKIDNAPAAAAAAAVDAKRKQDEALL